MRQKAPGGELFTIARQPFSRHQYDAYGDFMRLGAFSVVDRHSSELQTKHVASRIVFDETGCSHCLKCATSCSEMRVSLTPEGQRLLGPSPNYCTACRLCVEHCPLLLELRQDELPTELRIAPQVHYTGGEATLLSGPGTEEYIEFLKQQGTQGRVGGDGALTTVYQGDSLIPDDNDRPCQLRQYLWQLGEGQEPERPLLITVFYRATGILSPPWSSGDFMPERPC
ncbi:MAG: hypothetical protein JRG72_05135 [Deltaproteobacteria bacterium]|nr:hypothetical protein [Deltaproteobacteria bacterium]